MQRKELADFPFDKERFKEVIKRAIGDRSQADFCRDSLLSYAYLNKYVNGKKEDPPTIGTLKKISLATKTVTYEELLEASGYDIKKYGSDKPMKALRKDLIYPVFLGIANSDFDWKIESKGYKDNEPFTVIIERNEVNRWFFIPVNRDVTKEEIQNILMSKEAFTPGSKVSFITDDEEIFNTLKDMEFPLLSLNLSVIKVTGQTIIEETKLKTALKTDLTISKSDDIRPFFIGENK